MARETKQDRIVRTSIDQVMEHLHELKLIEANPNAKEAAVEVWVQSFLKTCLGYLPSSNYAIRSQEAKGKMRPDLVVLKEDKPIFVVEVKKFGYDLSKSDFRSGKIQLSEYLALIGDVKWGILTNGVEWKLYDFSQPQYGGIEIASFDLRAESELIDVTKKAVEEQCYEILDFHESTFTTDVWRELSLEALAFSPESLAKAILSSDVVKYIAKYVKGEHEYRANHEVLTDRVYWLLEQGLNDAISGWNESKAAELQKYVKSQKRAARKTKRTKKPTAVAPETAAPTAAVTTAVTPVTTTTNTSGNSAA